ncbi:MAG: LLM class flavin-dependent oxidoreductase [Crocinitomicaceae bacterium]|jgi:luciferase family oxidoreductase group 1
MMLKKEVVYSILDLAVVSQGKSFRQTFDDSVTIAKLAERTGYKRYWLAEHHNMDAIGSSATSILIGKIAEETQHMRVGSGGIMLPNHSPLIIAEQFGTLGTLYPNRIDLGLGRAPGTDQATASAIRSDFYEAAMQFPAEVQKIQDYFSVDNKHESVRANVAEGVDVPLYILGSSTTSAYLAAEKGLPYAFASHFSSAQLIDALKIYKTHFQPSATLTQPYTIAGISVIIADTDEEAEFLSSSYYSRVIIGILTGDRNPLEPPFEITDEFRNIIQHPSFQQMSKYAFIGSKETVKKKVKAFINQTDVDKLISATHVFDVKDRVNQWSFLRK